MRWKRYFVRGGAVLAVYAAGFLSHHWYISRQSFPTRHEPPIVSNRDSWHQEQIVATEYYSLTNTLKPFVRSGCCGQIPYGAQPVRFRLVMSRDFLRPPRFFVRIRHNDGEQNYTIIFDDLEWVIEDGEKSASPLARLP